MKPDYPAAIWRPAAEANYDQRPPDTDIDCVVLHATAGSLTATLGWFANPQSPWTLAPLDRFPSPLHPPSLILQPFVRPALTLPPPIR